MNRAAAEAAAALLGGQLRAAAPLAGGDLSEILCIQLADGRRAVVKGGPAPRSEARMLQAIAAAGAPAPAVLAVSDSVLVLEELPQDGALADAWADLGRVLARLHAAPPRPEWGPGYGWPEDHAFGPVPIPNGWLADWPDFWATRRLLPSLPYLPPALARRVERLAAALPRHLPRQPAPALLHGDLWSGNILAAGGRVSGLIDPACHLGHAEVDLAMLRLFGCPGPAFDAAYGGLEPDWQARLPVYQLWPALVHFRLFGSGYAGLVERCLAAAGA